MKITLEPGGAFPPDPLVAANIRQALAAAMLAVDDTAPTLQPGTSLTAWFNPETGAVTFYSGLTAIPFKFRNSIVSATPPTDPVPGLQWFNTNDGGTYTWYENEWVAGDAKLPFGVEDLLALLRNSTVSDTAPENPTQGQQWFNTTDGFIYTWYNGSWVAGEAAFLPEISALEDAISTKANRKTTIVTIADEAAVADPTHAEAYVRLTAADTDKTYTIPLDLDVENGTTITVRNVGANSELTILAEDGVTLNFAGTANLVAHKTTATLLKVATNEWDLI